MSNLLKSFFTKERSLAIRSLKKSNVSDSPMIRANCSQKTSESLLKIRIFRMFLTVFPLFMPKSELLPSLFTKDWPWATRSGCSWQKSEERNSLFFLSESLFRSYTHNKRANGSKNRWGNSKPCFSSRKIRLWFLELWESVKWIVCFSRFQANWKSAFRV